MSSFLTIIDTVEQRRLPEARTGLEAKNETSHQELRCKPRHCQEDVVCLVNALHSGDGAKTDYRACILSLNGGLLTPRDTVQCAADNKRGLEHTAWNPASCQCGDRCSLVLPVAGGHLWRST